jgi:2-aminoethylphosphonate-pyruvate transaminase
LNLETRMGRTPLLFTPGPLTTSATVKQAMLTDLGSRDDGFIRVVREVREGLLRIAGTSQAAGFEAVIMPGSGTFGVESMLGSLVPRTGGKLLVATNGAYGLRMVAMARVLGIEVAAVEHHERRALSAERIAAAVAADPAVTHVAAVHHETTAGVLSDMAALGAALAGVDRGERPPVALLIDSMSAFGAYPVDVGAWGATAIVSSSNKCIEGVPGFSYIVVKKAALLAAAGNARSLSLDLHAQWAGLESNGQFRFTPPTHTILAFRQALAEHTAEGGAPGRLARYEENARVLLEELLPLGFHPYVPDGERGCIITTFLVPTDPAFAFKAAYDALVALGCVIYPGKTTAAESFRIGSIGQLYPADMKAVARALRDILVAQGVALPVVQCT